MKNKAKAKLITLLMFILLCVLAADVVSLVDGSLPWVLGIFAIPGGIWFVKTLYKWIADDEDEDDAIRFPMKFDKPEIFPMDSTRPFKRAKR